MNVLLVNNRFFVSGGPERYLFTIKDLLEQNGNSIFPFSNTYSKNEYSKYEGYFLSSPVDENSVYFREFNLNLLKSFQLFLRATYSFEAQGKVRKLIGDEKIDIAYLLAIANFISPSIIDTLVHNKIPVVMRLSDFYLLCPSYHFLRDLEPCQECQAIGLRRAIVHRCMQNSTLVSLARVFSMKVHQLIKIYDKVDAFVTPSLFMKEQMINGGFPEKKIFYNPSPVVLPDGCRPSSGEYILYVGRIVPEKGLETLVLGFEKLKRLYPEVKLIIAGNPSPEKSRLEKLILDHLIEDIHFPGFISKEELGKLYAGARFTVAPSIWFENSPLSVYESLSYFKPVIASRIGSLPEQVHDGVNGLLFEPGNPHDLAEKMAVLWASIDKSVEMGIKGRELVGENNSPEHHLDKLLDIFNKALN